MYPFRGYENLPQIPILLKKPPELLLGGNLSVIQAGSREKHPREYVQAHVTTMERIRKIRITSARQRNPLAYYSSAQWAIKMRKSHVNFAAATWSRSAASSIGPSTKKSLINRVRCDLTYICETFSRLEVLCLRPIQVSENLTP